MQYSIKDFYFWKITMSLAIASFFIFASMYAVQPLLPVFVEQFGVSVSTSSLSISLTIIGLIIGLIVLGFLSDRNGRTFYIKFALVGSIIPFFLIPLMDSFVMLLVLRFIQGFALAGLPAASLAYISEEIEQRSVSVAMALYISSNALGGMMGRVLTGYITDFYSWETSFYFLASVGVVVLITVFIMLPGSTRFEPSNLSFSKDMEGFLFHLKNPSLLLVFGLGIILQLSFTGLWTYLPFYLQGPPFSLSLQFISYTFFAYGLGVIGSPFAGWLAGRFGLRPVRIVGIIIMGFGVFLTLNDTLFILIIGLCLSCLGFFTAHSLSAASVSEQATHHKGSASSLYLVSYYVGVAVGSTAVGPVYSSVGWSGLVLVAGSIPIVYIIFATFSLKRFT